MTIAERKRFDGMRLSVLRASQELQAEIDQEVIEGILHRLRKEAQAAGWVLVWDETSMP